MNIHSIFCLWITLVEKPVDNVENCQLSTGISLFIKPAVPCGNPA